MRQPLLKRKARLAELVPPDTDAVMLVGHFDHGAETIFRDAVIPLALEGLVAKRAASPYQPGVRSADWVKVKRKGAIPPERFKRTPRS
jgi:bifunctional non-homologous end joining protein LigD